jgi:glycosyltransferase involved in cell wall biosynthesis
MASGLPVVYSESGGTPELVGEDGGVGVLAPLDWANIHPPAAEYLADATKKILIDYNKYSSAARSRAVRMFDVNPWIERHREVFMRLIKGEEIEN